MKKIFILSSLPLNLFGQSSDFKSIYILVPIIVFVVLAWVWLFFHLYLKDKDKKLAEERKNNLEQKLNNTTKLIDRMELTTQEGSPICIHTTEFIVVRGSSISFINFINISGRLIRAVEIKCDYHNAFNEIIKTKIVFREKLFGDSTMGVLYTGEYLGNTSKITHTIKRVLFEDGAIWCNGHY